jgi:hypothetical protein
MLLCKDLGIERDRHLHGLGALRHLNIVASTHAHAHAHANADVRYVVTLTPHAHTPATGQSLIAAHACIPTSTQNIQIALS